MCGPPVRRGVGRPWGGESHLKLGTLALEKHLFLNVRCERLLGTTHSEKPFCVNERLGLF